MTRIDDEIAEWVPFARMVVARTRVSWSPDVHSSVLYAIWRALEDYDPGKGVSLSSYVAIRVKGAAIDGVRRAEGRIDRVTGARTRFVEVPSSDTLYEVVHLRGHNRNDMAAWRAFDGGSMFDSTDDDEDDDREKFEKLVALMDSRPMMERWIMRQRFVKGRTLEEIGEELGVTESRVCQIVAKETRAIRALYNGERVAPKQRRLPKGHRPAQWYAAQVAAGRPVREVAQEAGVSPHTVQRALLRAKEQMEVAA